MSKRFTFVTVALSTVVAFLVGIIIAGEFRPSSIVATAPHGPARNSQTIRPAGMAVGPAVVNFADIVERMNAAVVNIDSMSKGSDAREVPRFFRRGEGPPESPRDFDLPRQGAGSGFIIDRAGYILTVSYTHLTLPTILRV